MEVDVIASDVNGIIKDEEKYPIPWIIGKFNEALLKIATMLNIPGLQYSAPLSISIGATSVTMPKSYLHDLYLITSVTYPNGLILLPNKQELITRTADCVDNTGPVSIASLDGKILSVWPLAEEAETLTAYYYTKPKTLEAGDVFPDYIPETLHRDFFQSFALKEAYNEIEDGTDGKSFNTEKYSNSFALAAAALVNLYPDAPKARRTIRRRMTWF